MHELKAFKQLQRQQIDKTAHIRELLARESDLAFPNGVSLEEFLKAVKSSTSNKDYPGIPIYVDPVGLQEVDKTPRIPRGCRAWRFPGRCPAAVR